MEFEKSYEETSPTTPIFFILSPGVNPLKDVEDLGEKLGFTMDNQNFHNVSLGNYKSKKCHWHLKYGVFAVLKSLVVPIF